MECYWELGPDKATGIDGVDKELYGENVSGNIMELVDKLKNKSDQPKPTKRVYIPKDNGDKRPLGILSLEDKMVQMALAKIIGAIYEPVFLDCMYGFRPGRGCHGALRALNWVIEKRKTQWVLDADIKSYFGRIPHKRLLDCLKVKIKDPNILWLVKKYLKAGVMEDGKYSRTESGTIQGGNISPILANVYMHYMLTLWFYQKERHTYHGEGWLVNFADGFIACFQEKEDAEKFYADLKRRLAEFGLELQEEKTKLIEFGSRAQASRKAKGDGKPETFDFLGFTHYCSKSQKGWFRVKRRTSRKKFRKKVTDMGQWLKKSRGMKVSMLIKKANQKLRGHYQYYGITDNSRMLVQYC
ncbi:MAG: group II intron reverse transcriptase/maturase, partial [Eubacterium sp.]|nr:group II intron reverse transcriptase/maturase [Eubacterium sp.]